MKSVDSMCPVLIFYCFFFRREILLKSCNPFIKRRLPYIIGTNDFTKYDHLGLGDSSSNDEEEDELTDEVIEEEQPYDRVDVLPKKNFTNIASAQVRAKTRMFLASIPSFDEFSLFENVADNSDIWFRQRR